MAYQHRFIGGQDVPSKLGKIICVGRNYADHAKELNNPIPDEPLLFIKPATSAVAMESPFSIPKGFGSVHFETEMAILMGERLSKAQDEEARLAIAGVGLGLDLTLRDVQNDLKAKGQPWEKAKAFDGAAPLSAFVKPDNIADLQNVQIRLMVNNEIRQDGNSEYMLNQVVPLLSYISQYFTLEPGDVVLTGTPAGVGPIMSGDKLRVELGDVLSIETSVQAD